MLVCALALLVATPARAAEKPAGIAGAADPCTVSRVIDGDTVDVKIGEKMDRLRLLDIDTEESHNSPAKKITPFGLETSAWAKSHIEPGSPCWVEYGPERRDVYDRLLAYLWIRVDGVWEDYNLFTIQKGYAPYFTKYGYSQSHHLEFAKAQREAQEKQLGVWDPMNEGNLRGAYLGSNGLIAWWNSRADSLAQFETSARMRPDILDTRMHWPSIRDKVGERLVVFTSIRNVDPKASSFVGKCEGKLYEPTEIVAANGDAVVEEVLKGSIGTYRYFAGKISLADDRKTLRIEIAAAGDVSAAPPPRAVSPGSGPARSGSSNPAPAKKKQK